MMMITNLVGAALLLLVSARTGKAQTLDYTIATTWNGSPVDHHPVQLSLSGSADGQYLELRINAPFFNDPPSPPAPPGQPFFGLWEYEVVEAFFLNNRNHYLEVEVCPWGQHIVLLLSGQRVTIRHSLPLEVTTRRSADTWTGLARIPVDYLPEKVSKWNAYAIHGSGDNRIYESLYPADSAATAPDLLSVSVTSARNYSHALQYFQPIDISVVLPNHPNAPRSQFWADALEGILRYCIKTTWNSLPLDSSVHFSLQNVEEGVQLNVTAPFYNDPRPDGPPGAFFGLWDYEVVEMFFLNGEEEYLEVELGPWGHHLLLFLKGTRNSIKHSLPLKYVVEENIDPVGNNPCHWRGTAIIPAEYFPPNVELMNAYAIHGVDQAREYQALYPAPHNDGQYPAPDFHRLELFRPIDFEYLLKNNSQYSNLWLDAIRSDPRGSSTTPAS